MQFALGVCSSSAAAAALGVCSSSAAAARHVAARLAIDGIERRKIPIRVGGSASPLDLHVVEVADWSWWEEQSIDESANPFGAKLWPASLAVADYLAGLPEDVLPAMSVLEIGCGNGLCSLTVAARGAASVVASDLSEDALTLTREAAQQQGLAVQTLRFDLADRATPLPPAQLVIAADVLCARLRFEPKRARAAQLAGAACRADDAGLATTVAHRVAEAAARGSRPCGKTRPPRSAARAADWPRLAEARGRVERDQALQSASARGGLWARPEPRCASHVVPRPGSWVVVGDQRRAGRQAFERTLAKLSAPRRFRFERNTAVQLAAVGWKKKDVDLMLINPPEGS